MVRSAIDKALADRDQNLDKFCTRLDKDIALLGKEVKSIKQQAQVSLIILTFFNQSFALSYILLKYCHIYSHGLYIHNLDIFVHSCGSSEVLGGQLDKIPATT